LWSKEFDRFLVLEELAGRLVEELSSYRSFDQAILAALLEEFRPAAGRFARYPSVQRAIRDLQNVLNQMFVAKRDHEDDRELRSELDSSMKQLLAACDYVTKRQKLL
jgi:hypothetical protein